MCVHIEAPRYIFRKKSLLWMDRYWHWLTSRQENKYTFAMTLRHRVCMEKRVGKLIIAVAAAIEV
jgi:hypothetical protein